MTILKDFIQSLKTLKTEFDLLNADPDEEEEEEIREIKEVLS